ncbi:nuclear transport factor 2 family protein [Streptomyces sp. NBC_00481]|uniref:nuclear transport factor 2 family protein n=1 Tax=unclassified Streptomyces TaxID=2593676 RepID=UPI002DD97F66|nr:MULTISPECIES: nuclear transport factor 2 family protein [unclassified Streptomyces]WRZ00351.1 nuclear transport factor 2 family protein [Streptomyces sp. NBC_00481]
MSDSPNVALVRRLYDSGMAPDVAAEVIDPDVVWDITPGFPYGGVYKTWASAGADFFGRLAPNFTSFGAVPEEFYGSGDHVFVRGHYHAVSKSGQESDARFIHLWTVGGGKLTHLIQAADSHIVQQAANG